MRGRAATTNICRAVVRCPSRPAPISQSWRRSPAVRTTLSLPSRHHPIPSPGVAPRCAVRGAAGRGFACAAIRRSHGIPGAAGRAGRRPRRACHGRCRVSLQRPVRPAFRAASAVSGFRALWRVSAQAFAAPEGSRAVFLKGEGRGQDKGRQCAEPLRLGCGLDSQGFRALLRNVCGNPALCGAGWKPAARRVCRTLRPVPA